MDNRILTLLEKLREMRVERGCTQEESDAAAFKIGRMIQTYGLPLSLQKQEQSSPRQPHSARNPQKHEDKPFNAGPAKVLMVTEKALYIFLDLINEGCWVPKSVCKEECQD